jgi:hypothetical protein
MMGPKTLEARRSIYAITSRSGGGGSAEEVVSPHDIIRARLDSFHGHFFFDLP